MRRSCEGAALSNPRSHLPFLPIYVHDFLSSTEGMPLKALGAYTVLLCRAWDTGGRLPNDDEALAGLSRLGESWGEYAAVIRARFRVVKQGLENRKLRRVYLEQVALYRKRQRAGSLGGRARASNAQASLKHRLSRAQAKGKQPEPEPEPDPKYVQSVTDQRSGGEAPKAPSQTREFLTWFVTEYATRRNGATYFVSWAKDGAIVKALLAAYPPDHLRKLAKILLTTNDEWIETTDRGIGVLKSRINWLEDRLREWEAKQQRKAGAN